MHLLDPSHHPLFWPTLVISASMVNIGLAIYRDNNSPSYSNTYLCLHLNASKQFFSQLIHRPCLSQMHALIAQNLVCVFKLITNSIASLQIAIQIGLCLLVFGISKSPCLKQDTTVLYLQFPCQFLVSYTKLCPNHPLPKHVPLTCMDCPKFDSLAKIDHQFHWGWGEAFWNFYLYANKRQ